MKSAILVVLYLGSITSAEKAKRFAATLPNGATVELVGVCFHSAGSDLSEPRRCWRPDGSELADEPFRHARKGTSSGRRQYACEFALRISGPNDYSCATFDSRGPSSVQPVIPLDEKNESIPSLRAFICRFPEGRLEDTIRIGVSTAPWRTVETWTDDAWHKRDHDTITFPESENPLILTWPRQKGRAVILEMVRSDDSEEARRMFVEDRDGRWHECSPRVHGQGPGLVKEQYWFWRLQRQDLYEIQYQTRPYQWAEFRNVSLQPDRRTNVEVVVHGERTGAYRDKPQTPSDRQSLGLLLDRLAANLAFPATGQARYQIRESDVFLPAPRLLKCNYAFSGSRYALEAAEAGPESFHLKSYFDGDTSVRWIMLDDAATVWEGRREQRPIYRLDRFWPADVVEDLLGHDVEFPGSGEIDGAPCFLIASTLSSKAKLKVWASKEPAVFPLRIERYEHDRLRYLYEARTITMRNGVPFPEQIKEASYRWDDATGLVPRGSFEVTIESFEPNANITSGVFTPQFSPETTVTRHEPVEAEPSVFEPTTPARRIQSFSGMAIPFELEQAKGNMLLVCFFDMNQRPARRCVLRLAEQAKDLEKRSVQVVAVQVPNVDKDELAAWAARQNIPFPVGRIESDIEKTKSAWGVQSLPWLILADAQHIVRAEGFAVNELDREITNAGNR